MLLHPFDRKGSEKGKSLGLTQLWDGSSAAHHVAVGALGLAPSAAVLASLGC